MFTKRKIFFIFAETPVHCGSGSSVGTVDLPIQREVYNELPVIHGQGLKGAIRDFFENNEKYSKEKIEIIFGPKNTDYSSCISFGQANLLFFPIPSFKGVFAYATSLMCLEKFFRTFKMLYPENTIQDFDDLLNSPIDENKVLISKESAVNLENKVILSNLVFDKVDNNDSEKNVDKLANFLGEKIFKDKNYDFMKKILLKNLVILNDTVFSKLTKLKTEIVHRNKIGENGIVEEGALWTEEYLPSDTIMWSTIFVGQPKENKYSDLASEDDVLKFIEQDLKTLFIGGNKTIGKGLVSIHFCEVQNEQK